MTEAPDQGGKRSSDEPEPPLDRLYALYRESLEHDRKKMMADAARAGDSDLEELIAKEFQPVPLGEFRQHLDELEGRGVRHIFVNRLVRGPIYCESHPDDESVCMPREERVRWAEGFKAELDRALREDRSKWPGTGGARRG